MRRGARAFTLIELLVVISIISVLVALLFPVIGAAYRGALEMQCQRNIGQLAQCVIAYCQSHDGYFPYVGYSPPSGSRIPPGPNDWLYIGGNVHLKDADITMGALWRGKYISGEDLLLCPLDGGERAGGAIDPPVTSYVINGSAYYYDQSVGVPPRKRVRKYEEFDPNDFLFIEEGEESSFADAYMCPDSSDSLTTRHREGGYVSCMDGSVHWMKAEDPRDADDFRDEINRVGSGTNWQKTNTRWNPR